MNNNPLVLSVYSRSYKAANDEQSTEQHRSSRRALESDPLGLERGWDPYEVWRTRIRRHSTIGPRQS
jgi:hypothetical protein